MLQTTSTWAIYRFGRRWYCALGAGTVLVARLGRLLLLHLERCEVDW